MTIKNLLFLLFVGLLFACTPTPEEKPLNVLFIGIDDLRPELGCYGSVMAVTPSLDKLAGEGLLFNRAYCQQAICGPSRASLMTGIRPSSSGVTHNYIRFREKNPEALTLAQHFMNNGYETAYYGKIFHHGDEDSVSWSVPHLKKHPENVPLPKGFHLEENIRIKEETKKEMLAKYGKVARYGLFSGSAYECADVPDNGYADGYNTDLAIATMKELAKGDKPFFLGLGMHKPHLNWTAPKKYWDMYNRDEIPMATVQEQPVNAAEMGLHPSFELRVRSGIPKEGDIDPELSRTLKHAYMACVSYVDAQIGRTIKALEKAGIRENTVIIVWSDHGWHLGDMGIWGKATNYEIATRVPLMIWAPDIKAKGVKSDALVELVDMYPTLCDLAGLPVPESCEGQSFVPLMENPGALWKTATFSQFPTPALREWGAFPLRPAMRETFFGPLLKEVENRIIDQQKEKWDRETFENHLMGYAMRTDRYRFIVWKDESKTDSKPIYFELYDHKADPDETRNIAAEQPELTKKLLIEFNRGWQGHKAMEGN